MDIFVAFQLTLNMVYLETHKAANKVIESCLMLLQLVIRNKIGRITLSLLKGGKVLTPRLRMNARNRGGWLQLIIMQAAWQEFDNLVWTPKKERILLLVSARRANFGWWIWQAVKGLQRLMLKERPKEAQNILDIN